MTGCPQNGVSRCPGSRTASGDVRVAQAARARSFRRGSAYGLGSFRMRHQCAHWAVAGLGTPCRGRKPFVLREPPGSAEIRMPDHADVQAGGRWAIYRALRGTLGAGEASDDHAWKYVVALTVAIATALRVMSDWSSHQGGAGRLVSPPGRDGQGRRHLRTPVQRARLLNHLPHDLAVAVTRPRDTLGARHGIHWRVVTHKRTLMPLT